MESGIDPNRLYSPTSAAGSVRGEESLGHGDEGGDGAFDVPQEGCVSKHNLRRQHVVAMLAARVSKRD